MTFDLQTVVSLSLAAVGLVSMPAAFLVPRDSQSGRSHREVVFVSALALGAVGSLFGFVAPDPSRNAYIFVGIAGANLIYLIGRQFILSRRAAKTTSAQEAGNQHA